MAGQGEGMWGPWFSSRTRRSLTWLGLALATLVFLYIAAIYVQSHAPFDICYKNDEVVSRSAAGYLINDHDELCGTPAASATTSLQLIRNAKGQPSTFFSYAGSIPYLRWMTSRRVLVTVFHVDEIYQKSNAVGGVQVSYNLGTNYERGQDLYSECNSPNYPPPQRCIEYVAAVSLEPNSKHCSPGVVLLQTYVDDVRRWIKVHPGDKSKPASVIVKNAIKQAFPCETFPRRHQF
jgi:hypothetical protein